jgi:hypothetical protein
MLKMPLVSEDAMLRIRIVCAAAGAAIAVILAAGAATAQSATTSQAGQPLALLAGLSPPHATTTAVHTRTATRTSKKIAAKKFAKRTRLARKSRPVIATTEPDDAPVQTTSFELPATPGPLTDAALPADAAAAMPPPKAATPPHEALVVNTLVVDGETVQVASPDEINAIDLAADEDNAPATLSDRAAAALAKQADAVPAKQTVFAAAIHRDADQSAIGSASWIAQVLAALGGAVAAGAVAWFLIGGGPQRMFG